MQIEAFLFGFLYKLHDLPPQGIVDRYRVLSYQANPFDKIRAFSETILNPAHRLEFSPGGRQISALYNSTPAPRFHRAEKSETAVSPVLPLRFPAEQRSMLGDETTTGATRTGQHGSRTDGQRRPPNIQRLERRPSERRGEAEPEACQRARKTGQAALSLSFMRMWEYAFAWGKNGHIYETITGSREAPVPVREYIAQLGRDCWELCCSLPERDGHTLIFKREARS